MEPLTLSVLHLAPLTLLSSTNDDSPSFDPVPSANSPSIPIPPPPTTFPLSQSPQLAHPNGVVSLGSPLSLGLQLRNSHVQKHDVLGVRMMVEIQSPSIKTRLGEIIHQTSSPADKSDSENVTESEEGTGFSVLRYDEAVILDSGCELKELGNHMIICSVAWETLDGRKTFQRFYRFTVNPPLAMKTRVKTPQSSNLLLNPLRREDVYLEILMQNVSKEGILFDKVLLEAVQGLTAKSIISQTTGNGLTSEMMVGACIKGEGETLLPGDTRQYLFLITPDFPSPFDMSDSVISKTSHTAITSPKEEQAVPVDRENDDDDRKVEKDTGMGKETEAEGEGMIEETIKKKKISNFPPNHLNETVLPLGRLDLSWHSGPYRHPGRLQTSTLNQRFTLNSSPTSFPLPTRTTPASPRPVSRNSISTNQTSIPPIQTKDDQMTEWEFDLISIPTSPSSSSSSSTLKVNSSSLDTTTIQSVYVEHILTTHWRLSFGHTTHSSISDPPSLPQIAIQRLSITPQIIPTQDIKSTQGMSGIPDLSIQPPSRTSTPMSSRDSRSRPFSPPTTPSTPGTPSRPFTPLSAQLRQATNSKISTSPLSRNTNMTPSSSSTSLSGLTGGSSGMEMRKGTSVGITLDQNMNLEVEKETFPPFPSRLSPISDDEGQVERGELKFIGPSLIVLPLPILELREERLGPTYEDSVPMQKWEGQVEFDLSYLGWKEGLSELGGLRVLLMDNQVVGREWDTLGNVWVEG
ncbi:hypothetical protein M231_04274 [Tremella mesenterica]|uniref:Uncharacterized protein n=1 Tax=Tremella mesenterica TaxID=5217 RepID=A0A4Q1BL54_TREME|nr:hypothetical protein M231_04274 [Tremella mesenterica]